MGKKDRQRRKKKEERQNAKLWAEGKRDELLTPHLEPYREACLKGWVAERDYLRMVCNHFFQNVDWRLDDKDEPPGEIKPYDPNRIDTDDDLTPEEIIAKHAKIREMEQVGVLPYTPACRLTRRSAFDGGCNIVITKFTRRNSSG